MARVCGAPRAWHGSWLSPRDGRIRLPSWGLCAKPGVDRVMGGCRCGPARDNKYSRLRRAWRGNDGVRALGPARDGRDVPGSAAHARCSTETGSGNNPAVSTASLR